MIVTLDELADLYFTAGNITDDVEIDSIAYGSNAFDAQGWLDGIIKAWWPISQTSLVAASLNFLNTSQFSIGWVNDPNHGPNGVSQSTNAYGNTKFNPVAQGMSLNNIALTVYIGDDWTSGVAIGNFDGANIQTIIPSSGGNTVGILRGSATSTLGEEKGAITVECDGTNTRLWKNGVNVSTVSGGFFSFVNLALYVLAWNNNNSAASYGDGTLKEAIVSERNGIDFPTLHSIIHTRQGMIGRAEVV